MENFIMFHLFVLYFLYKNVALVCHVKQFHMCLFQMFDCIVCMYDGLPALVFQPNNIRFIASRVKLRSKTPQTPEYPAGSS